MTEPEKIPADWRGTPITKDALVIYGAGVGRSIQLVEGTVDGFTAKGSVKVRIVRRSYTSGTQKTVTVGPDRLTIVDSLPPTEVPTQEERNSAATAAMEERKRIRETHDFPASYHVDERFGDRTYHNYRAVYPPCTRCGAEQYTGQPMEECPTP